jgi:recombinational DNA repair ATPase RecF
MIKLESAHIEEVRGIRKLDIEFAGKTFAISGPNGTGKSGVIDAIEFGLTGQIGRLMGRGTKGLTVAEHGPHVDKTKFSDAAFVVLKVSLPMLKKTATITRKVSAPKKPKIEPNDADVLATLAEVADHPEITLSRREILRFILIEPTKRSEEIQTILKLDDVGQTRGALNTAQNRLGTAARNAFAQANANRDLLLRHLQSTLRSEDILAAVNQRRTLLGLTPIAALTAGTNLDAGLSASSKAADFNKVSALRDVVAFRDAMKGFAGLGREEADAILSDLALLEADPALLIALHRTVFIEKGLELVEGPECPLCNTEWNDEQQLRDHLQAKLAKSEEARTIQQRLLKNGSALVQLILWVGGVLDPLHKAATASDDATLAGVLQTWKVDLAALKDSLDSVDGLAGLKDRLTKGWLAVPKTLTDKVTALGTAIEGRPDQTATVDAQTFLSTAQVRLSDYREATRTSKAAEHAATLAKTAYDAYCGVMEDELDTLYEEVQSDFTTFYRTINQDDEATFSAKLTPSAGKLDLDVNFYERGLFPPGAFHSEGHQDSMGVCLYLALMKRLMSDGFTFALLDDVVMSVDAGHRYQFCKLLKTYFPNTQFIITTHDRLWAEQMRSAGLVTSASSLAFHSWTIDTGPLVESNADIWDEIAAMLGRGKVETASHALRHHLEYVSRFLADQLGAAPAFRADGNYELGELLQSVLSRMKQLYGKIADAAQSWGNHTAKKIIAERKDALANSSAATNVEQWAVNKAVHYNEWANFGKKDFEPVVAAFEELLECFRCDKCQSWLHVTPRQRPESLRCACNAVNLNLMLKPKQVGP